jgi:hypothetical protein
VSFGSGSEPRVVLHPRKTWWIAVTRSGCVASRPDWALVETHDWFARPSARAHEAGQQVHAQVNAVSNRPFAAPGTCLPSLKELVSPHVQPGSGSRSAARCARSAGNLTHEARAQRK